MAGNYSNVLAHYYKLIGQKPRIRVIPYFKYLRRNLRCPACGGSAHIEGELLVCDSPECNRSWKFEDLLYPPQNNGPATSSGPASSIQPPEVTSTLAQPELALHAATPGCANSFYRRLI